MLIISDSKDGSKRLQASLSAGGVAITIVDSPSEVRRACQQGHDLVIVDVGPECVADVLRDIRSSARHAEIPVLVEAGRISRESSLVGVLPRFRAMPCSGDELIKLARGGAGPVAQWREEREAL